MKLILTVTLLVLTLATACLGADESASSFARDVQPLLKQYCFDCHGSAKQKSGVRFDQVERYRNEEVSLWTKVHEAIASGKMPPLEQPQPAAAARSRLLSWIETQQRASTGGLRRLNRRELSAALRDVTGLSVEFADGLPGDGRVAGFDTGAEGLQDAADSVEAAMKTTRRAVDGIRFLEPAAGQMWELDLRGAADPKKAPDTWKARGGSAKPRGVMLAGKGLLMEPRWVGERDASSFVFPPPDGNKGIIRVKLVVSAMKPMARLPNPHLWVEVSGKDVDYREVAADFDKPLELEYQVQLEDLAIESRGISVNLSSRIEVPYSVEGFPNEETSKPEENVPGGTGWFRPQFDRKLPPDKQPAPIIVLHRIEIETGYVAAWPPASWNAKAGELADNAGSARRLLSIWIERAWRRPVSDAEQERFHKLYEKLRGEGLSFDGALRATFQSVLLSRGFRYLVSPSDPDKSIAQHAIASRLSFMLWGAPPDAELRQLAVTGKMRDPSVLDQQVDRLLADPRREAFVRPFVLQWLEMEQPITIASTHIKKQDFRFARHLKASMRDETIAYVSQVLAENKPAGQLIASDWTMMNDILAIHYGYEGVEGGHLRKMKLRDNDPRGGGILGHAGIQSMLTWMGGNWVIYRGAWALRHILDDPPPPPPLEVPELNANEGANKGKPFRELLRQHQEDANCTVCHRKMDPVGFAFQNFDISGRWREVEHESYHMADLDGKIEWRGAGAARPVDAAGKLPRGEEFKTYNQFKQLAVKHYTPDLVRGLMKNLVIYSTGRLPDVHDLKEIRAIMKEHEVKGFPLRDMLKGLVRSKAFLER